MVRIICLHVDRQRGRNPIGIDEMRSEALRFEEDLMPVAVAEAMDLVLDRRAIARSPAFDRTGK